MYRRILAEEGLAHLPTVKPVTVTTPCGTYEGLAVPSPDKLAVVSIVRAGGFPACVCSEVGGRVGVRLRKGLRRP